MFTETLTMIDISSETLIAFSAAPSVIPGRPHQSTLQRWRLKGVHDVRLESCLLGGRRYTSLEALERFFEQTTAAGDGNLPSRRTSRQRRTAQERARKVLSRAGIVGTAPRGGSPSADANGGASNLLLPFMGQKTDEANGGKA
jgi:hypothetical protein